MSRVWIIVEHDPHADHPVSILGVFSKSEEAYAQICLLEMSVADADERSWLVEERVLDDRDQLRLASTA